MITRLIIVCGLPGSGKSYFAKQLSEKLKAAYLNSDIYRKELYPNHRTYSEKEKQSVYDALLASTETNLIHHTSVVLDATFYKNNLRIPFYKLAKQLNCTCEIIYLNAEESLVKERTSKTREDSEANYSVYLKLKDLFEPIDKPFLTLQSTNTNIDSLLSTAQTFLLHEKK
ncbi:AAA family ATPase [Cytophaga aurantiaca]|uniref:AAA family ATPase n=1 Tax=Cytophaga aurantiaca TaxID=29530 RepID=UPI00037015F5|nr:ATP-binding protein [Cytophaga aurantiaca]